MDYTDLVTAITNYTENTEVSFQSSIPTFVQLAEEQIYRHANIPLQSKVATLSTTATVNTVALPSDYLAFDYVYLNQSGVITLLLPKAEDYIYQVYGGLPNAAPMVYGLRDNSTIIFGPTPDAIYTIDYKYKFAPVSITVSQSSWLGTNAQNCLLYGSLVHAYTYMKGSQDMIEYYNTLYTQAMEDLRDLVEGLERKDEYRTPMNRRIPPPQPEKGI